MKKPARKVTAKAVAKAAPASAAFEPKDGAKANEEADTSLSIKKKAFIEEAVERSGIKKKFAKPAIEVALALLSEALLDEKKVNIPPLGKLKVNRKKNLPNAKVLKLSLRVPDQIGSQKTDGLSDANADRLSTSENPK